MTELLHRLIVACNAHDVKRCRQLLDRDVQVSFEDDPDLNLYGRDAIEAALLALWRQYPKRVSSLELGQETVKDSETVVVDYTLLHSEGPDGSAEVRAIIKQGVIVSFQYFAKVSAEFRYILQEILGKHTRFAFPVLISLACIAICTLVFLGYEYRYFSLRAIFYLQSAFSIILACLLRVYEKWYNVPLRELEFVARRTEDILNDLRIASDEINRSVRIHHHEIRTPLNVLCAMSDSMDLGLQPTVSENTMLCASVQSLLERARNVLDMSALEANLLTIDCAPFDFRRAMRQLLTVMRVFAQQRNLRLDLDFDIDTLPCEVSGDAARLHQALHNLLENAIAYASSPSTVLVGIQHQAEGENQIRVEFTIRNDGDLPLELLPTLFDIKLSDVRDGRAALGLYIAHRLASAMHGHIWVGECERGQVVFKMDVLFENAPASEPPKSRLHILYADDSPSNLLVLRSYLKSRGHEIHTVHNGLQAVEAFKSMTHDFVFLDMEMPIMDGLTACAKIREYERDELKLKRPTPIVIVTAHSAEGFLGRAASAGSDSVLGKPIDKARLLQCVDEMSQLGRRPSMNASIVNSNPTSTPLMNVLREMELKQRRRGQQESRRASAINDAIIIADIFDRPAPLQVITPSSPSSGHSSARSSAASTAVTSSSNSSDVSQASSQLPSAVGTSRRSVFGNHNELFGGVDGTTAPITLSGMTLREKALFVYYSLCDATTLFFYPPHLDKASQFRYFGSLLVLLICTLLYVVCVWTGFCAPTRFYNLMTLSFFVFPVLLRREQRGLLLVYTVVQQVLLHFSALHVSLTPATVPQVSPLLLYLSTGSIVAAALGTVTVGVELMVLRQAGYEVEKIFFGWQELPLGGLVTLPLIVMIAHLVSSDIMRPKASQHVASALRGLRRATIATNLKKSTAEQAIMSASHDLRAPINMILCETQKMTETLQLTADMRWHVRVIQAAAFVLLNIIESMVDMKLLYHEHGLLLQSERCEPRIVIWQCAAYLSHQVEAKNLHLLVHIAESLPAYVMTDTRRLTQLLVAVLGVSIKLARTTLSLTVTTEDDQATPSKSVDIHRNVPFTYDLQPFPVTEHSVTAEPGSVSRIVFLLRDDQPPILQKDHESADSVTDEVTDTTVSFIEQLTKQMGGTWHQTHERAENVLRIGLPMTVAAPLGTENMTWTKPVSVLAVQPSQMQYVVKTLAQNMPCKVTMAATGLQAQSLLDTQRFDVILIEMHLPDMSGVQLITYIRQQEQSSQSQPSVIAAVTRVVSSRIINAAKAAGCDSYIALPLEKRVFCDLLRRCVPPAELITPPVQPAKKMSIFGFDNSNQVHIGGSSLQDVILNPRRRSTTAMSAPPVAIRPRAGSVRGGRGDCEANSMPASVHDSSAVIPMTVVQPPVSAPQADAAEGPARGRMGSVVFRVDSLSSLNDADRLAGQTVAAGGGRLGISVMTAPVMVIARSAPVSASVSPPVSRPLSPIAASGLPPTSLLSVPGTPAGPVTPLFGEGIPSRSVSLDMTTFQQTRVTLGADDEEFGSFITTFLDESRSELHNCTRSFRAMDCHGLDNAAHKIKGSSGYFGAWRLASFAQKIVSLARESRPWSDMHLQMQELLEALSTEFSVVEQLLADQLAKIQ
eukprot:TRINITY_DN6135_c0_g1_i1.p1 TRINITY_DN6135_c0_g1~~TRINITY_DN6135_c0_g1_i1.p1  ORF type:complete len:1640 (+),score=391.92 TRINITY_DN6135_c0_g1_i1:37-4920(+)